MRFAIRVVELVVISCVVELAMTLPMALYFHRITIFALPVNLLIVPVLVVLMPAALLTLLLLVVWPAAAVVPAMVVALVMHAGVRPRAFIWFDWPSAISAFPVRFSGNQPFSARFWERPLFLARAELEICESEVAARRLGRPVAGGACRRAAAAGRSAPWRHAHGGHRRGPGRLAAR